VAQFFSDSQCILQGLVYVEVCCLCLQQTVTEEKFSILFQSQFSVGGGELVFQVWVSVNLVFCHYVDRSCGTEMANLLPRPNMLMAVSKGMSTVKLCSNKILQFFVLEQNVKE